MCAGTEGEDDGGENTNGIVHGHAYSLLAGAILTYKGQ